MRLSPLLLIIVVACRTAPVVDPEARGRSVLDAAVTALGGTERISGIESWDIEGSGRENLTAEIQGLSPDQPTWRPHQERIVVDAKTLSVAWHRKTPRNDNSLRWRRLIYKPDASGFFDHVINFGVLRPAQVSETRRRSLIRRVPHLLLLEASTHGRELRWTGQEKIGGERCNSVSVALPDDVQLALCIGEHPATLRSVSYRRHIPTLGDSAIRWEWFGWKEHEGIGFVPGGHRIEVAGVIFQEVRYSRFQAPSADVGQLLDVPNEMGPRAAMSMAPGSALPRSGEVAPGVHVAQISGFTVMFVEFRDFVVAVETPAAHPGAEAIPSQRPAVNIAEEFLALIRRTVPDKPLRYVVISHHHSDHMGGLRSFAAAGATLLVAPDHRSAAMRALSAPHTLDPDSWKGTSADARVESIGDRRVLTDGTRRMEVINVGPNPHTDQNLFVWLPAEGILFQGDLFYYEEGEPFPPSGRATMNRFFAGWLRAHQIEPRGIYGVHSASVAGPAQLAEALRSE